MTIKDIIFAILTALIGGLFAFMWWDIRRRDKISNTRFNKKLYRENGQSIYLPRGECQKEQATYAQIVEMKFDAIRVMIKGLCKKMDAQTEFTKDMDRKRENTRAEFVKMIASLNKKR